MGARGIGMLSLFVTVLGPHAMAGPMETATARWDLGAGDACETEGAVELGRALPDWEAALSRRHAGDGHAAVLEGGRAVLRNGSPIRLGDAFTIYVRLRAEHPSWEGGILRLELADGPPVVRIQGMALLEEDGASVAFEVLDGNGAWKTANLSLTPIRTGIWHDLVFEVDGGSITVYAEGLTKECAVLPTPVAPLEVAQLVLGGGRAEEAPFKGTVDHVVCWDRALSDKEVRVLGARSNEEEIALAEAHVTRLAPVAAFDPERPRYHALAPAGRMGDPNGPVYHQGKSHLMYQFFPYWGSEKQEIPGWGHMVSSDFVRWEHWPIAIMPEPGTYDYAACASGACAIDDKGVPTIVYTSVPPQAQSIATSQDGMRTWTKHPGNPLVHQPALEGVTDGFRDPFVWREADGWYMIVGTAIDKVGGAVTLHHSKDLRGWTYLHPHCVGEDPDCMMWKCPNFFPLGDKYVLIVSPLLHSSASTRGDVIYSIGDYVDHRFIPGSWHRLDFGGHVNYYAPNSYADDRDRRLLWGCIGVGSLLGKRWHGAQTLLRELTLRPDGVSGSPPCASWRNFVGSTGTTRTWN